MQLMPRTAASLGVEDAFDPAENLDGGVRHLGALLALYGGDVERALAAYNAGEGAVARHRGIPPFRETREYVKRVLERYERAKP
jgi:soluble lytic murein transglycosylase-like protein